MSGGDRPAGHFRTHGTRFDHDHVDPERGDFASQGVTDRFERELRTRVRTVCSHRDLAANGADVDHPTSAPDQVGQQCLGHGDVTEEVDLEQASPLVDREGLERDIDADACVVHERPHRPALRVPAHPRCQCLDVGRVGDVDDQRLDPRPPNCVGVLVAPDTRKNVETPAGQFACRRRADARGRAGDDDDLLQFS